VTPAELADRIEAEFPWAGARERAALADPASRPAHLRDATP
jgi:hypothetical protein